jgi:F-type H+-transporting ATPase subunit gamma
MATTRQIRSRIRVAKNIQQITKAMKMVAAARLRRAQEAVNHARPYAKSLLEVMQTLGQSAGSVRHPLLRQVEGEPRTIGVLVITSDRGLCGSFNTNAIRRANELVKGFRPEDVKLVCVGKRGATFFRRRGYEIVAEYSLPATGTSFENAKIIARTARQLFENGDVDVLQMVTTRFISAITQQLQNVQLFPLQTPAADPNAPPPVAVEFEPSAEEILEVILPKYVDTVVFQALIESTASALGAQMTSMSAATDNAGKMISTLTLSLNRARQATITKEISEIVGGADALR